MAFVSFEENGLLESIEVESLFNLLEREGIKRVVIGKNHPYNHVIPSPDEQAEAQKIKECGLKTKIEVVDQLIMSRMEYFSFSANGH